MGVRYRKRQLIPAKVAGRLEMLGPEATKRYEKFVKPIRSDLERMAEKLAGKNKALVDSMVTEAVIRIMAAGKGQIKKPVHFARRVGKRAMFEVLRIEKNQRKLAQTRSFEYFLSVVDKRAKVKLPSPDVFKAVETLLEKAKVNQETKDTFRYHYMIGTGSGLLNGQFRTLQDTAKHFGIPVNTVSSQLRRVKTALRKAGGLKPESAKNAKGKK